jgi:predicted metal-dependent enzyme (double-stranded beta helix superfamily)
VSETQAPNPGRLRDVIAAMTRLVDAAGDDEARILSEGRGLLAGLVAHDDWLPPAFAEPDPESYRQYLLHCDPLERFSVVSFVWEPGQKTPVHDHTVWGLVGQLRGSERSQAFVPGAQGHLDPGDAEELRSGDVTAVSPRIGDVHEVSNAGDETAVSIHVYGGNIGAVRRHVFDPQTGAAKEFVSGYSRATMPNVWDRSQERP